MMNPLIYRLKLIHARLDTEISRETQKRFLDFARVQRLKKLKLAIKDRLYRTSPHALRPG